MPYITVAGRRGGRVGWGHARAHLAVTPGRSQPHQPATTTLTLCVQVCFPDCQEAQAASGTWGLTSPQHSVWPLGVFADQPFNKRSEEREDDCERGQKLFHPSAKPSPRLAVPALPAACSQQMLRNCRWVAPGSLQASGRASATSTSHAGTWGWGVEDALWMSKVKLVPTRLVD